MPKFTPTVRTNNEYNDVHIRISHHSKNAYVKTNLIIHKSGIKKGLISDYVILGRCATIIKNYIDKINNLNVENLTVQELKKILINDPNSISFSKFARNYIGKMYVDKRTKSAVNYKTALHSLEIYYGKEIFFHDLTSFHIKKWIEKLKNTARAKQMYPTMISKIFEEGCNEFNDYDRDILRVKNQPFRNVKIPQSDLPKDRFADIETVRKILNIEPITQREELAHDVSLLTLYLAGINTIDLYSMEKKNLKNGKLCYNRSKEKNIRKDKAYFEITVPAEILPLFEKYKGEKCLFNFCENHYHADGLSATVRKGLKTLCQRAEVQCISIYWLRHTWATVARNECGFSAADVAFGLNHASAHKVTEMYIKKDFSLVDKINAAVIEKIFE